MAYARFGPRFMLRGHHPAFWQWVATPLTLLGSRPPLAQRQPRDFAWTNPWRGSCCSQDLAESAHGGRSMTSSLIAPVAFRVLAQTTLDSSASQRAPWGLFALALVALILFVALTGLLVLLARRAPTGPTQAHRDRRPLVPSGWGLERGIDPDAAATDSVRRPPVP